MNPLTSASHVITHPVRTAASVAGRTIGMTFGASRIGLRTTAKAVEWAVERAGGPTPSRPSASQPSARIPGPIIEEPTPAATPPAAASTEATGTTSAPEAPAKKAPATKAPAKKASAKKAPAKKAGARKAPSRKAPSRKAAVLAPALGLSEAEVEAQLDDDQDSEGLRTPSGIPAAGEGYNPDTAETDLHQPGTEPLMDPATTKAAVSEHRTMQQAADTDKG